MIDPSLLCRKHLLGCHGEIHKHRNNFVKQHRIDGRIYPIVQIEPASMKIEHDRLAAEMIRRGYSHQSPYDMPDISYLGYKGKVKVDREVSLMDLKERCVECRKRIEEWENENGTT